MSDLNYNANNEKPITQLDLASETAAGIGEIATQTETNTGTDDARFVTPLKLENWTGGTGMDGAYLRLDTTNDPLTNDLQINGKLTVTSTVESATDLILGFDSSTLTFSQAGGDTTITNTGADDYILTTASATTTKFRVRGNAGNGGVMRVEKIGRAHV